MAKAKQWVGRFNSASVSEVDDLLKAYAEETAELISLRSKGSGVITTGKDKKFDTKPAAVEGALREQRQKWQAICRQITSLGTDHFDHVVVGLHLASVAAEQTKWKADLTEKKNEVSKPEGDGRKLAAKLKGS